VSFEGIKGLQDFCHHGGDTGNYSFYGHSLRTAPCLLVQCFNILDANLYYRTKYTKLSGIIYDCSKFKKFDPLPINLKTLVIGFVL
jgi:hypothetical protein